MASALSTTGPEKRISPSSSALGRLGRGADGAKLVEILRSHAPSWLVHFPALLPPDEYAALGRVAPQSTPARMLRELAEALDVLTAQHALILVLEDLHWSDTATLEWLAYVTRRRDPARLAVLGTYRPLRSSSSRTRLRTLIPELRQHPQCTELVLDYLSVAEVATYVRQRCRGITQLEALAHVLHQRTSGHPLFLVTLVDELMRQRLLVSGETAWHVHGDLDAVTEVIPASVRQFISSSTLSSCRAQTRASSKRQVWRGVHLPSPPWRPGVSLPEEVIEAQCTAWARQGRFLQAAGMETWPDGTVTACFYTFRHALYHEVVYRRVSAGQRIPPAPTDWYPPGRRLWRRRPGAGGRTCLALYAGTRPPRAVWYLLQAAQNAMRRSAYPEARAHLTNGLELVQRLPAARGWCPASALSIGARHGPDGDAGLGDTSRRTRLPPGPGTVPTAERYTASVPGIVGPDCWNV